MSYLSIESLFISGSSFMKTTIFGGLNAFIIPWYFIVVNHPFFKFSMKFHAKYLLSLQRAISNTHTSAVTS